MMPGYPRDGLAMIVSHQHRFIFIKTRKTAGTSIEVALSQFCGDDDIVTPISPDDESMRQQLGYRGPQNYHVPLWRYNTRQWKRLLNRRKWTTYYNHIPASEARRYLGGKIWNSYYKFCFDRNPWDRVVSAYFWQRYQIDASVSFEDFLSGRTELLSNFDLYSIDSRIAVDFVGRYENLAADLRCALGHIGLPQNLELPRLKAKARTDKRPYQEIITPEQEALIASRCAREIALLDYQFGR